MSHRSRHADGYRRYNGNGSLIKFRRKGGFRSGVSLGEAMANVRLSGNDSYTFADLAVDHRDRIMLRIRVSAPVVPLMTVCYMSSVGISGRATLL